MNPADYTFLSPVEKKEKRAVKPKELTPFEGMEVTFTALQVVPSEQGAHALQIIMMMTSST